MIIGIDLGTTYSAVAAVEASGRAAVLPNRVGELTTPSALHFASASEVVVGTAARTAAVHDPDNALTLVKRLMGDEVELRYHGVAHTPESASALILRALVDDARAHLGGVEPARAVITVPAYFGIREREATITAARLAGIEVLELLAEPVAAAVHYGCGPAAGSTSTVLVYDLGGGTFDTTVLRVEGGDVRVVATDGDARLGGADWDARLAEYLVESFVRAGGEITDEDEFTAKASGLAEAAKRALSARTEHRVTLRDGSIAVPVQVTRGTVTEVGADLVARTLEITRRCLASAAAKGYRRIDEVVLVGGSTRMPAIADSIGEALSITPRLFEPDLAVVLGAAQRAKEIAETGGAVARSVVPRSFGILLEDSHDPAGERTVVAHVVHQNDELPARRSAEFRTILRNQRKVRVQVYEQAGDVASERTEDNRRVLDGLLDDLPDLPAAAKIRVELSVSANGLLSVEATEPKSGKTLRLQAYVDGVLDAAAESRLSETIKGLAVRH
ncbi:Hsp70 family protein [Actinokineospora sp. G85]|uniref:Hsp70 family protein n=1 Tax=Actinokineospora sp. G85 TaxID=3406626 RepID=UPI003C76C407